MEGKGFRDGIDSFRKHGLVIFGVSFDSVTENAAFAQKFAFPFDLLCDTRRELGMLYGACDTPDAKSARRISILIGADGRVLKVYDKVKPDQHPAEVLVDLDRLG